MLKNNYQEKIDLIVDVIKAKDVDALLLVSSINRFWLTSFDFSLGYIIINKDGKIDIISDTRYILALKNKVQFGNKILMDSENTLNKILNQIKEKYNIEKILIEEEYLSIAEYNNINSIFATELLKSRTIREVKFDYEVELLQKAADIVVDTIDWVKTFIKPGISEKELAQKINIKILELGAEKNSFSTIVAAGKNGSSPHHQPTDYIIQDGDMVTIDLGCMYGNYASDMTRSFIVGEKANNDEMVEIYNLVKLSQSEGLKASCKNADSVEIDSICRKIINDSKYKDLFAHGTGHGVGIEVHELPVISTRNPIKLKNGNVITIEPGIYKDNVGGVRIEDTIVIKDNNPIILTGNSPKELEYIYNK